MERLRDSNSERQQFRSMQASRPSPKLKHEGRLMSCHETCELTRVEATGASDR